MGPFELADLTGLDVGHDVYVEGDRPVPPALAERVEAGDLGQKTGQGYYDYDDGGAEYDRGDGDGFEPLRIEARMVNAAARLVGEGVATAEDVDTGMRLGAGFPEGICRRGDEIGLDAVLARLVALHQSTGEARYAPDPHLVDLVERGHTGADAGRGFFAYETADREFEYLNHEVNDGVLAVEIDRPDRHNALSVALRDEIVELFSGEPPEGVRCVTIEGAGDRAFSAGADISEFLDTPQTELLDVAPAFQAIADYPRPVIAKIDGLCLGGGFEVALACDLRIATERSTLGFPEIDLGLLPGGGGTQRLRRLVGPARTKELVFRGNHIDADRAASWGILNRAVPAEEFEATVESFLADLREGPPVALDLAKQVVDSGGDASLDASLRLESHAFGLLMGTDDATEGITAFMDDREPTFDGE
jgi:enoyl-CoA hydratase/3-hydroxyacyl-CoA dehydrogenase